MKRRIWEAGKSLLLLALIVSALILTLRGWVYDTRLLEEGGPLRLLRPAARFIGMLPEEKALLPVKPADSLECLPAASPYAVAVRGGDGLLRGAAYDNLAEAGWERVSGRVSEALGTAGPAREVTPEQWEAALRAPCIFWEYPAAMPLSAVAAWVSFASWDFEGDTRRMVLSAYPAGENLTLYYSDGGGARFFARTTRLPFDAADLDGLPLPVCRFVFEDDGAPQGLYPYMLLPQAWPELPVLRAMPAQMHSVTSDLLTAFAFNPNTNAQYTEAGGTSVYVDKQRTLRVSPGGKVRYRDASPSFSENALTAVLGSRVSEDAAVIELCRSVLPGDTGLQFLSLTRDDGAVSLYFGYVYRGAVLLTEDGGARFTLENGMVTEAAFTVWQFDEAGPGQEPLPLRQAAALLPQEGAALRFCYTQQDDMFHAEWYASP